MTAGVTAASHGLTVVVVDEQARAGGQIFRQPPPEFAAGPVFPAGYAWGRQLIRASQDADQITWRFGATAYGVLHEIVCGRPIACQGKRLNPQLGEDTDDLAVEAGGGHPGASHAL